MTSFRLKLEMYELKIYRGVMCHDNEEWCKNWRGIDLSVQNWHEEFDEFWPEHSEISKKMHFNWMLLTKVYHVWAKKVHRSYFDGTEYWCKIWRKTDFALKNDMRSLANFHQNTLKSIKIDTLMGYFYPMQKIYKLKI